MNNKALKQVFKRLQANITKEVNPDSVIDKLVAENIINEDDYLELRQAQGSRNRCRDLFALLLHSTHPETFIQLRLALLDHYPWIVNEIDQELKSPTAQQPQLPLGHSTNGMFLSPAYNSCRAILCKRSLYRCDFLKLGDYSQNIFPSLDIM